MSLTVVMVGTVSFLNEPMGMVPPQPVQPVADAQLPTTSSIDAPALKEGCRLGLAERALLLGTPISPEDTVFLVGTYVPPHWQVDGEDSQTPDKKSPGGTGG